MNAAQEGDAIGLGRGLDAFLFETRQDEAIQAVARPGAVLDGGLGRANDRAKRPVLAADEGRNDLSFGNDGAGIDPAAQEGDLASAEARALGRHWLDVLGAED